MKYPNRWEYTVWAAGYRNAEVKLIRSNTHEKAASMLSLTHEAGQNTADPVSVALAQLRDEKARASTQVSEDRIATKLQNLRLAQQEALGRKVALENAPDQQLRAIAESQDPDGFEQLNGINLFSYEARKSHEDDVAQASEEIKALAETYGEVEKIQKRIRDTQTLLSKNKGKGFSAELQKEIVLQSAKLEELYERLMLSLDQLETRRSRISEANGRIAQARDVIQEHPGFPALMSDSQFSTSLAQVRSQLQNATALGNHGQAMLDAEIQRIPEILNSIEKTLVNHSVLSSGASINTARPMLATALKGPVQERADSVTRTTLPSDLLGFLEQFGPRVNQAASGTRFQDLLKNAVANERALEKQIALVTDTGTDRKFYLLSTEEALEEAIEQGKYDSIWALEADNSKTKAADYRLKDFFRTLSPKKLRHRAVWEIQGFDPLSSNRPRLAVFEIAKTADEDLERAGHRETPWISWLDPSLMLKSANTPAVENKLMTSSAKVELPPSRISLSQQIALIHKGDLKSLAYYAFEEKAALRAETQRLSEKLSELGTSSDRKAYLSHYGNVTKARVEISMQVAQSQRARDRLQSALEALESDTTASSTTQGARTADHLRTLLQAVDIQLAAARGWMADLEKAGDKLMGTILNP